MNGAPSIAQPMRTDQVTPEDDDASASSSASSSSDEDAYARKRLENIQKRQQLLEQLGLKKIVSSLADQQPKRTSPGSASSNGANGGTPNKANKVTPQKKSSGSKRRRPTPLRSVMTRRLSSLSGLDADPAQAGLLAAAKDAEAEANKVKKVRNPKARPRPVERDEHGQPIMPLVAVSKAPCRVLALGAVDTRDNYHSVNYIWPVGFRSEIELPSYKDRNRYTVYINEILEGGDEGPIFRVTPADAPDEYITASAATRAWSIMLAKVRGRATVSVSGPEMIGYADPTIKALIEELPGAEHCMTYKFRYRRTTVISVYIPPTKAQIEHMLSRKKKYY